MKRCDVLYKSILRSLRKFYTKEILGSSSALSYNSVVLQLEAYRTQISKFLKQKVATAGIKVNGKTSISENVISEMTEGLFALCFPKEFNELTHNKKNPLNEVLYKFSLKKLKEFTQSEAARRLYLFFASNEINDSDMYVEGLAWKKERFLGGSEEIRSAFDALYRECQID